MTNAVTTMAFVANENVAFNIRIVDIKGEPWFVAADVIKAIYGPTNSNAMPYSLLGEDERSYINRIDVGLRPGRPMVAVSESDFYKLIMRSDKPEARKFQDWVTREVLPAIRKTGGYLLNEESRDTAKADDRVAMPLPEGFPCDGLALP